MGPTHILQTVHIVVLVLASFVRSAPGATPRFDPSTPIPTLSDDDLSPTTTLPAERSVPDTPGPSATASLPPSGRAIYTDSHLAGVMTRWGHDDSAAGVSRLDDAAILTRVDVLKELRDHSPVSACRTALSSLLEARNQLKIWALKMHSSTVALPDALLSGTMYHMGDFDGCLGVPDSMYCTLDVEVRPVGSAGQAHDGDEVSPFDPPHGANGTLWDVLKTSGNRRRYRRDLQQWSLCLPEACGVSEGVDGVLAADADLRRQLGMAMAASVDGLAKTMGVELVVRLDPNDCTVYEQEHPAAEGFWAIVPPFVNAVLANLNDPLFLLGSLFIVAFPSLVALASALHIVKLYMMPKDGWLSEKEGALMTVLSCFSLQTNFNALKKQRKNNINAVQGLRFMNMVFVILGHRCMNLYGGPTLNPEFVEDSFTMAMRMYIINGNIIVSTFFVISAFFSARLCLAEFSKPRGFTLPLLLNMWLHRFLRFLPGLAVVVTIEVLWVEHMGTGPIWNQLVGRSVQDCKNNWWSHLLFVNNYVNPNSLCLIQSWFLAADFQLFLLTPLVMWLVSRWTRRGARCWPGFALLAGLLLAACASHYVFSVLYNLHPMVHTYPQVLRRWIVVMDPTFIYQYVTTHSNAIPYVIGLMAGTLFHLAKQQEWEPSKWMRRTLFLGIPVSHGVQVAIFCTGVCFFLPTFKDHPMADALYGPARMLLFSSATAWVIVSCGLGFGGFFEWILTFTPLRILGRLTYSVFLVHITYINVTAGYTRSPEFLASFFVALKVFADVMASFMLGAILHLFVEAPMWNVQKLLLTLAVGTKKDETPAQESRTSNAVAAEAPPNYLNRQDVNTISARVAPTTNWPGMAVSSSRL